MLMPSGPGPSGPPYQVAVPTLHPPPLSSAASVARSARCVVGDAANATHDDDDDDEAASANAMAMTTRARGGIVRGGRWFCASRSDA